MQNWKKGKHNVKVYLLCWIGADMLQIYTDGSYRYGEGAVSWLILTNTTYISSGVTEVRASTSAEVELAGLIEGIRAVNRLFQNGKKIHLYCDCITVCKILQCYLTTGKRPWKSAVYDKWKILFDLIESHDVRISYTKGHLKIRNPQTVCDMFSRKYLSDVVNTYER